MTEQNEPSMEAILASIRSILAEDDDETPDSSAEEKKSADNPAPAAKEEQKSEPAKAPAPAAEAKAEPETDAVTVSAPEEKEEHESAAEKEADSDDSDDSSDEGDVLDLTAEMIVDDPSGPKDNKPEEKIPAPSLPVEEDDDDDFTPEPVIPQEPMKEETLTDLIKENAAKKFENDMLLAEPTVAAATESLSHLRDIAVERQLELGNATLTIEAIVRETLKPYLKEWLDSHLPEIVERVVRKEVAHIMDRLDLK